MGVARHFDVARRRRAHRLRARYRAPAASHRGAHPLAASARRGAYVVTGTRMKRTFVLIGSVAAFVILSKVLIENVMGLSIGGIATAWIGRAGAGSALTVVTL